MSITTNAERHPETTPSRPHRVGSPLLVVPATAYAVLTVAGVVTYPGIMPTDDAPSVLATLQASPVTATVYAALLVAASAPLAVWAAAATHRLRALGARVAAPVIGLSGGVLAAAALAASGLVGWTAAEAAALGDPALVRALSTLAFAFGGVGFAIGSALLIAGVAVPVLVLRLVPRWLGIVGLVVAAAGAVSVVSLAVPALFPLLPVVRFGGLLWLIAISVTLPRAGDGS